jgi:hypothetical protein
MFMSPSRSELKAMNRPSGDQAPRLSSRLLAMSGSPGPVGSAVAGSTGSRQRSAFCDSTVKASRSPEGVGEGWMSCPAPVVNCSGCPPGAPAAVTGMRQTFQPPPRYDEK